MSETIVKTTYGKVQGGEDSGVPVWKGIPFAAPPIGRLRFRPPQPPQAWEEVRDATRFGAQAMQRPSLMERLVGTPKVPSSEDCLYLNIWSPAADNARRPVLFWIHGGGFVNGSGSSPWYNGASFAEQGDVVVVTINYRLGVFGFLHLAEVGGEEFATSGNCGMLDQIAALEWVRDNIAAFGGDPDRVTIFGESAGAMSVGALLAMPAAKGLFKQAILQSGAAHNIRESEIASKAAKVILENTNFNGDMSALGELSADQLLDAAAQAATHPEVGTRLFQPVVDGVSLPIAPRKAIADGFAKDVTVLIGTTSEEMKLFTMLDPTWTKLDEEGIKKRCMAMVGEKAWGQVAATYADYPAATPLEKWTRLLTDKVFWTPALHVAESQVRNNAPVWMYRFDWKTSAFNGQLGACHALEIPFVFNNLGKPGVVGFTGDKPERQAIADKMQATWIAFARNGDPNTTNVPDWPAYNLEKRSTMIFDSNTHLENDPQAVERQVWSGS